nr:hypothetical protein [Tanacetum cinerariifolium]
MMDNLSEDIQCVSFDTRPPTLDRTDLASWQQRIRLYCQGKRMGLTYLSQLMRGHSNWENGVELDEEQLLFIAGGQDNAVDEDYVKDNAVPVVQISKFSDMHEALSAAQKRIAELESENFNLQNKIQNDDHDVMELYDSIKIKRAKTIEKTNSLLIEVANLKAQIQENHISNCVIMPAVKSKVLALGRYAIDIELIPISIRNNWEVHLDYLKHLKESVETLHEIVEEAKVERPLDRLLAFACLYTKHSQELLEYLIGTCLKDFNQ